MSRTARIAIVAAIVVVVAAVIIYAVIVPAVNNAAANNFSTYTSAAGKFSVSIPGTVKETTDKGALTVSSQPPNAAYIVIVETIPGSGANAAGVLDSLRQSFEKGLGGTAEGIKDVKLGDAPGIRFLLLDAANLKSQITVYIKGDTIYELLSKFSKDAYSQENADKFVNSFTLK